MSICIVCGYPSDGNPLCIDCRSGIEWAKNQRLQADFRRKELTMTDWGHIVAEVEGLLERSPEMRMIEDKVWHYLLGSIHPIWGERSIEMYAKSRERLCEYLRDHLGKEANPCSKKTPDEYTDWLWFSVEMLGFLRDNPALKQVEPECWEWMLNQTYPLPPNHAPTAKNMVKAVLENFMGSYGATVRMIMEMESRMEAERLELAAKYTEKPKMVCEVCGGVETVKDGYRFCQTCFDRAPKEVVPGLLTPEAAKQLENTPKPQETTTSKWRR